jgi:hypothetical protein
MCGAGGIMNIYVKGAAVASPASSSVKPASSSVKPASSSVKPASTSVKPASTSVKPASSSAAAAVVRASSSAAGRTTTAVATSSARVVARGIDEAGDEFEEEEIFEAPSERTVFVRETVTETAYHFVTVTETAEAPETTHLDRAEIPFLHKPHGHGNLNHHVGMHM